MIPENRQDHFYGAWAYNKVTTWGGALKPATPKSTTSVKLSWTKIKGAMGYEIYRCEGSSIEIL